ncbi:MAG TPA: hypothetical protein VEA81_03850 [Burkholderiaceae bacterium]|nr:hypothetical protein [Burkholderiaceae bacterium]
MDRSPRSAVLVLLAALAAPSIAAAAGPGAVVVGSSDASRPAATSSGERPRSVGRAEVARLERVVSSTPSTTIWQSRLPDGTIEFSDQPPGPGEQGLGSRSYALPDAAAAQRRGQAERESLRRQAEGFERRREAREREAEREAERELARARLQPSYAVGVWVPAPPVRPRVGFGPGYGVLDPSFGGPAPSYGFGVPPGFGVSPGVGVPVFGAPTGGVASPYASSPGAAQGRSGGFIGSGFATGR